MLTLIDLHRSGELAARYPAVPRLLAELPEDGLAAAGQLLSRLDPDEVLAAHPATTSVTIALTGHGTLAPLTGPLTAELARHGLLARLRPGEFDGYVRELGDPGSDLYSAGPDLVLCLLDPMVVFDEVPVPWTPDDVEAAAQRKLTLISRLAACFQATSQGTLVLNTLPLLHRFTAQLVDHRSRARLAAIWHEANARLLRLAGDYPAVVVVDLMPFLAQGIPAEDTRLSRYAGAYLSPPLLARYAREIGHLARHLRGQTKKVLALDLDGTVWGGVLGEDGADGIEVAGGYRGEAFRAFQRVVRQLAAQGVLVAAVSKNDPEPVQAVFRDHPEMTLRADDFVRVTANWRPKHDNLAELCDSLNLGADSVVFVDDSPQECALIRHAAPGAAVVPVDAEPAWHVQRLLRDGWFDTRELTGEDRTRTVKYRSELDRKDFLDSFDSLADFLRELQITMRLSQPSDAEVARVSQLTLRTNQFNLTTWRLQPAQVRAQLADPGALVLAVRTQDRFGDNGLVGAVFAHRESDRLLLDNFLLSCRVFGRGIEQACLRTVLRYARAAGLAQVSGRYQATAKNATVRDFYPRNGFAQVAADGTTTTYRHDLAQILAIPEHIRLAESPLTEADGGNRL